MILNSDQNFVDQINVALANTAVPGPAGVASDSGFVLTAHPSNTATVWVFENAAGKTTANGYPIETGSHVVAAVCQLDQLQFESTAAGQKICWLKL